MLACRLCRFAAALLLSGAALALAQAPPPQVPSSSHVFLIVEENTSFSTMTNPSDATNFMPWLVGEGTSNGHTTNYLTDSAGSLLDYLWLSSGSCHGDPSITDCVLPPGTHSFGCTGGSCVDPITDDNIYREMIASGISWKLYAESIPDAGYMGPSVFPYDTHHNPAIWYSDILDDSTQQDNIVPFTQFTSDLAAGTLPRYSIIIPDDTHDAHDGTPAAADAWLRDNIGPLLNQPFFQPCGDGLLIVTFDNGDLDHAGLVYTALIGPKVKPGGASATLYHHEHALRTILDALGITTRPGASATVSGMTDLFITPAPCPTLAPTTVSFPGEVLQVPSSNPVTLTNGGDAPMNISSIAAGGDFTSTDDCGASLAARASCTVTVNFTPTATGARAGTLTVTDSAPGSPHTVGLSGTGLLLGVSPPSLVFPGQLAGSISAAQSVTVSNPGASSLTVTGVSASAGFAESDTCGALDSGIACTVNVTFTPAAAGPVNGSVTLVYNGTQSVISVSGTGTDFAVAPQPGGSNSAPITAGQTAVFPLSLAGLSGFHGTVDLSCSGAPPKGACMLSAPSVTLNGSGPATFTASVSTMATTSSAAAPWPSLPRPAAPAPLLPLASAATFALLALLALRRARMRYAGAMAVLALAIGLTTSCGGGASSPPPPPQVFPGTPAGAYTVVVTATSGAATHTFNLTLNVQ